MKPVEFSLVLVAGKKGGRESKFHSPRYFVSAIFSAHKTYVAQSEGFRGIDPYGKEWVGRTWATV